MQAVNPFAVYIHVNQRERRLTHLRRHIRISLIHDLNKEEGKESISGSVTLKDLIEAKTEYNLIFLLKTETNEIRYYTRNISAVAFYKLHIFLRNAK